MLQIGEIIDNKYEIVSGLGRGGFGAVYKAKHLSLVRDVAIKILDTNLLQQPDGLVRFEREAKAINAIRHKNIVGFYGFGVWHGAPYMVMELAEGTPLNDVLTSGPLALERAIKVITQVLEALGTAHKAGVVHRDLKPSNIMLDETDTVKIIDFGLARLMPGYGLSAQKLTETGLTLGTCNYMAPEQALGGDVGQQADIYAAGCIFYEMLAGRMAFEAEDEVSVMYKQLSEEPEPLAVPQPIEAFLRNCMAKDPTKRYLDCDEALQDLHRAESGKRVIVSAPKAVLSHKSKSHMKLIGCCVASALIAAGAILTYKMAPKDEATINPQQTSVMLMRQTRKQYRLHIDDVPPNVVQEIKDADSKDHLLTDTDRFIVYAFLGRVRADDKQSFDEYLRVLDELYPRVHPYTDTFYVKGYADLLEESKRYKDAATVFSTIMDEHSFGSPDEDIRIRLASARNYAACSEWEKALAMMQPTMNRMNLSKDWGSPRSRKAASKMYDEIRKHCKIGT